MDNIYFKNAAKKAKYSGAIGAGTKEDPYMPISAAFLTEVSKGNIPKHSFVQKFGTNHAVGTSFVPITLGGIYNMPQPAAATTLRVKAGNVNDTAAGSGAREITLEGLDETGALVTEVLATAGASASLATTTTFIRLLRFWVSASGTYANIAGGSHAADIVIENGAGGTDWGTIAILGFPHSQSSIGAYTVPLGYKAYMLDFGMTNGSSKSFDFIFFKRESILDAAAPYKSMRLINNGAGITVPFVKMFPDAIEFEALTDIVPLAKVAAGTGEITVDINLLLVQD